MPEQVDGGFGGALFGGAEQRAFGAGGVGEQVGGDGVGVVRWLAGDDRAADAAPHAREAELA